MKKQKNNNKSLKEKLGQHEFQLPESGWQNMEAMLDGRLPVPKPTKTPLRWWAPGGKWGLSSLLVLGTVAGVLAGSFYAIQKLSLEDRELELSSFLMHTNHTTNEERLLSEISEERALHPTGTAATSEEHLALSIPSATGWAPGEVSAATHGEKEATTGQVKKTRAAASQQGTNDAGADHPSDGQLALEAVQHNMDKSSVPAGGDTFDASATREKESLSTVAGLSNEQKAQTGLPAASEGTDDPTTEEEPSPVKPLTPIVVLAPDLLETPAPALEREIDPVKEKNHFNLGLKWGGDFRPGMNSHVFGLHFSYHFNEKWMIEAGAQYKERSFVNNGQLVATFTDTAYWPDRIDTHYQKDSIRHLTFGEFPIIIGYQVRPRLSLFAGGQLTLTGNRAHLEVVRRQRWFGGNDAGSFSKGGHFSPGIVRLSTGMIVGGHYRLNKNFGIDLRYLQGLTDLTYDEYFGDSKNYLNSSVQLTLKWYWL
jgi:hypothetical protein